MSFNGFYSLVLFTGLIHRDNIRADIIRTDSVFLYLCYVPDSVSCLTYLIPLVVFSGMLRTDTIRY